jgi:hypothetical protein
MATQKQRRRRAKEKRHDYDLVFIDEDGVEKPVERDDAPTKPAGRTSKGSDVKGPKSKRAAGGRGRQGRVAQPPSWRKVLKRGAIFAPIFLATVMLLGGGKISIQGAIVQTVLLISVFIPFSYFMDRVVWRQQQKRMARGA